MSIFLLPDSHHATPLAPAASRGIRPSPLPSRPARGRKAAWVPDRSIRLIAPFAAGGAADVVARVTAEGLGQLIGQQIIVENRTGAGGAVGTELVARARPDGYTLTTSSQATHGINPVLTRLSFDPATDTTPIAIVAGVPAVLHREQRPADPQRSRRSSNM
jgi:tripartite-type tricarboxylate transporter receptor subunit TctC